MRRYLQKHGPIDGDARPDREDSGVNNGALPNSGFPVALHLGQPTSREWTADRLTDGMTLEQVLYSIDNEIRRLEQARILWREVAEARSSPVNQSLFSALKC
jgi:hypothetical protein